MNRTLIAVLTGLVVISIFPVIALSQGPDEAITQYNRVLMESSINPDRGTEVLVREAYFPPGWTAPRHYHNGNLFIYVIEGEFEVIMEPMGKVVYRRGDALQMKPGVTMDARNPSDTNPLKLSVFQVGKTHDPFVVPVE